ncbi:hypothetical protein FA15DRAFT_606642, partial [Coprinopsis marcescibilis]
MARILDVTQLPGRAESESPKWDGHAFSLRSFIREFEDLMLKYNVPKDEYTIYVVKYIHPYHLNHWETVAKRVANKKNISVAPWTDFLEAVYLSYPGSGTTDRFTRQDLEAFVRQSAMRPIVTMSDFSTYWRDFGTIADFLRDNGKI